MKKPIPMKFLFAVLASISAVPAAVKGIHPSYTIEKVRPTAMTWPIGDMDFFSNGDMAVASWKDPYDVYLVKGATGPAGTAVVTLFAQGLTETLGMVIVNDTVFAMQKDELTALIDNDKDGVADEYRTIANRFSKSTMEKEYAGGVIYDGTYFYGAFGDQTIGGGTAVSPMMPGRLNGALRFSRDGTVYPFAGGFRVPMGVGLAFGEMWTTENQGGYRPSNPLYNIREKRWYGRPVNPPSVYQPGPYVAIPEKSTYRQAAVWMPYASMGGWSPGNPLLLTNGPFKGQILVPDASTSGGGICRNFIEKVKGEYQGATIGFSRKTGVGGFEQGVVLRIKYGPDGAIYCGGNGSDGSGWVRFTHIGLDRLKANGKIAMDLLALRNLDSNTMEFEFTKPLSQAAGTDISASVTGTKWWEQLQEKYGGGYRTNLGPLTIVSAVVSADRMKLIVKVGGLTDGGWVHNFKLIGITSSDGESLWGDEAWYTLNNFGPAEELPIPVERRNALTAGRGRPMDIRWGADGLRIEMNLPDAQPFQAQILDLQGRVHAVRQIAAGGAWVVTGKDLPGVFIVKVSAAGQVYSRLVSR